ncbi:hypothetical protein E1286_23515 [Nonomuraea terrae]|uniref:Uncharacterized protein n=1 Tax=Nonomuraea terrae TaxID=2530383 RepID=A0A4R4YKT6_9ACTN|nr:hypothetical protein [Nonomuraea terrae]TDD45571.1 hypothetical protein E1286_23515 [Nonomuraea terrae]
MRIDPAQQRRLQEICDNPLARITEAERDGRTGEAEGLHVSLAAAEAELAHVAGLIARRDAAVDLGMPTYRDLAQTSPLLGEPRFGTRRQRPDNQHS